MSTLEAVKKMAYVISGGSSIDRAHVLRVKVCSRNAVRQRRRRAPQRAKTTVSAAVSSSGKDAPEPRGVELYRRFLRNVLVSLALSAPMLFAEIVLALSVFTIGILYSTAALLNPSFADKAVVRGRDLLLYVQRGFVKALKKRTKFIRKRIRDILADDEEEDKGQLSMTSTEAQPVTERQRGEDRT
mmetsp:Transcript_11033/g.33837  ORF Transcript_11033/g.33837 Transcript_11033/m.33837 type:complete len:186 (+) Transcript_11033:72-629(+)